MSDGPLPAPDDALAAEEAALLGEQLSNLVAGSAFATILYGASQMDDKMRTDALLYMVSEHTMSGLEVPEVLDTTFGGRRALVAMWTGIEAHKMCDLFLGGRDRQSKPYGPYSLEVQDALEDSGKGRGKGGKGGKGRANAL